MAHRGVTGRRLRALGQPGATATTQCRATWQPRRGFPCPLRPDQAQPLQPRIDTTRRGSPAPTGPKRLSQLAVAALVFRHQPKEKIRESPGCEGAELDWMLEGELHLRADPVPVVVDAKIEHHLLPGAAGVAEIRVRAIRRLGLPLDAQRPRIGVADVICRGVRHVSSCLWLPGATASSPQGRRPPAGLPTGRRRRRPAGQTQCAAARRHPAPGPRWSRAARAARG